MSPILRSYIVVNLLISFGSQAQAAEPQAGASSGVPAATVAPAATANTPPLVNATPAMPTQPRTTKDGLTIQRQPEVVYENTSAFHRDGKKFQVTAQLLGVTVWPVSSSGLSAGFFINRNSLVQLEYTSGDNDETLYTSEYDAKSAGVHYKHFLGNSFYANVGGDYRKIKMHANDSLFGDQDGEHIATGESLALSVSIGNQWQWENFTLGCDWIGFAAPVATLSEDYNDKRLDSSYDRKIAKSDWEDATDRVNITGLRFYLGASF